MVERAAGRMQAVAMALALKGGVQVDRSPKGRLASGRSELGEGAAGSHQMTGPQKLALPQMAPPSPLHVGPHDPVTGISIDELLLLGLSWCGLGLSPSVCRTPWPSVASAVSVVQKLSLP